MTPRKQCPFFGGLYFYNFLIWLIVLEQENQEIDYKRFLGDPKLDNWILKDCDTPPSFVQMNNFTHHMLYSLLGIEVGDNSVGYEDPYSQHCVGYLSESYQSLCLSWYLGHHK